MKRFITKLVLATFVIVVISAVALIGTTTGTNWVIKIANNISPVSIHTSHLQGSLLGTVLVDEVVVNVDQDRYSATMAEIDLTIAKLFLGRVALKYFEAKTLEVALHNSQNDTTSDSSSAGFVPPVAIEQLNVENFSYISDEQTAVRLSQISVRKFIFAKLIEFNLFEFSNEFGRYSLKGQFGISETDEANLSVAILLKPQDSIPASAMHANVNGNWQSLQIQFDLTQPIKAAVSGTLNNLFGDLEWNLGVSANSLPLKYVQADRDETLKKISIISKGTLNQFTLTGHTDLISSSVGKWKLNLDALRTANNWQLNSLTARSHSDDSQLVANGSWQGPLLPSTSDPLSLNLSWNKLQLSQNETLFSSETGVLTVEGSLDAYSLKADTDLVFQEYAVEQLRLAGKGTLQGLQIDAVQAQALSGKWQGSASLQWAPAFSWRAQLNIAGVSLKRWLPKVQASIKAALIHSGEYTDKGLEIETRLESVTAKIDKHTVRGGANVIVTNDFLAVSNANFKSLGAHANVSFKYPLGDKDKKLFAKWNISAKDLSRYYPDVAGSINTLGSISGPLATLNIDATLNAKNFTYETIIIDSLQSRIDVDMSNQNRSLVSFNLANIRFQDRIIESTEFLAKGLVQKHQAKLNIKVNNENSAQLAFRGGYNNNNWSGNIQDSVLQSAVFKNWKLKRETEVTLSANTIHLGTLCYNQESNLQVADHQAPRLCITVNSKDYSDWRANLKVNRAPLALLKRWLPEGVNEVDGDINAEGQVYYWADKPMKLNATLDCQLANVNYQVTSKHAEQLTMQDILIRMNNIDQPFSVNLSLELVNRGALTAQLQLPDWDVLQPLKPEQVIKGSIEVSLNDLDLVPGLVPDIQNPKGKWQSQINISGSYEAPKITGHSTLEVVKLLVPRIGTELENLKLDAQSSADNSIAFSGELFSNGGKINMEGDIRDFRAQSLLAKIHMKGENFTAVRLPEAHILISPDIIVIFNKDQINMEGEIFIPKANINIFDISGSLTPSRDVVFVQEKQPVQPALEFKLESTVKVGLGKEAWIRGYGFEGRLEGELVVNEASRQITTAIGELNIIDGKYNAYDKELKIERGKLIFTGGSIENPNVAIFAVKKIDENISVGVSVQGAAASPKVTLYSEPTMDEIDILSYLILGYPVKSAGKQDGSTLSNAALSLGLMGGEKLTKELSTRFGIDEVRIQSDSATEQTSLVLGKYLSPKLYIGYAIGVGQAVDTLQMQYKLTEQWLLKTESGEFHGADLIFTIEK